MFLPLCPWCPLCSCKPNRRWSARLHPSTAARGALSNVEGQPGDQTSPGTSLRGVIEVVAEAAGAIAGPRECPAAGKHLAPPGI